MKIKTFDRKPVKVQVPEWADEDGFCDVWLKPLSGSELIAYCQSVGDHKIKNIRMELLLALSLVDEQGKPLFADVEEGESLLRRADPFVVAKLYSEAVEVSGLGEKAGEEAKKA